MKSNPFALPCRSLMGAAAVLLWIAPASAQDRLKTMPGYEQYQKMSREIPGSVRPGALRVTWKDGGKAFEYRKDGKAYRYDIAEGKATEVAAGGVEEPPPFPGGGRVSGAGRAMAESLADGRSLRLPRRTASSRPSTATATSG